VVPLSEPLMQYRQHEANQLGVVGLDAAERTRAVLGTPRDFFLGRCGDFEELRARLEAALPDRPERACRVAGKTAHYRARGGLPPSRLGRVAPILSELLRLRYSRYSGTTLACVRDLISRT